MANAKQKMSKETSFNRLNTLFDLNETLNALHHANFVRWLEHIITSTTIEAPAIASDVLHELEHQREHLGDSKCVDLILAMPIATKQTQSNIHPTNNVTESPNPILAQTETCQEWLWWFNQIVTCNQQNIIIRVIFDELYCEKRQKYPIIMLDQFLQQAVELKTQQQLQRSPDKCMTASLDANVSLNYKQDKSHVAANSVNNIPDQILCYLCTFLTKIELFGIFIYVCKRLFKMGIKPESNRTDINYINVRTLDDLENNHDQCVERLALSIVSDSQILSYICKFEHYKVFNHNKLKRLSLKDLYWQTCDYLIQILMTSNCKIWQ